MLDVDFVGLRLRNPIIVSSSSLTATKAGVVRAADGGAGAVVLKSLFEEQIDADADQDIDVSGHPEAADYVRELSKQHGPSAYVDLIRDAKRSVDIPVIASINATGIKWWSNYAKQIEAAGADAIELNMSLLALNPSDDAPTIEKQYTKIVDRVRRAVNLPIIAKIGPGFTALGAFIDSLRRSGARAVVLFNRFYQLDINIDTKQPKAGVQFSSPTEITESIRWISLLYKQIDIEFVASSGIHDAKSIVKEILAGAQVVQVCSTIYKNGFDHIRTMADELSEWMTVHGAANLAAFRGDASRTDSDNPAAYERLQYIKALTGIG